MPPFDGIGANEYIVTVAHDVCHFISAVDTPAIWELNIWYHTLNCGFRAKISGETDFPCIYGDKVGLGRIYVKQPTDRPLNFDSWVQGIKEGRSYCGDGLSHVFDFTASDAASPDRQGGNVSVGEPGSNAQLSQLKPRQTGPGHRLVRRRGPAGSEAKPRKRAVSATPARRETVLAHRAGSHR